jgi:SulP family sulfate permease
MILAMFLFIRKVSRTTTVSNLTEREVEDGRLHVLHDKHVPAYVTVFRIYGPLLFGTNDKLQKVSDHVAKLPPIVILKLRHMTAIDATGLRAIEELAARLQSTGRALIVCGAQPQPAALMAAADFAAHVGAANICSDTSAALHRAREIHRTSAHVA